jgi:predicted permease
MADGVSIAQVRADAERVVHETDAEFGHTGERRRANVVPLQDRLLASSRAPLDVFVAGGLLVLFIACANVATLLVGRAVARDREFAVRIALGAGRGRLLRGFIAESAMIAGVGAAGGMWLAEVAVAGVRSELAALLPHAADLGVGVPVAFWSVGVAMTVAIVCGAAPATTVWRGRVQPLRGLTVAGSRGARRLRGVLVVVQVALALALVIGASLLGRTFLQLTRTDLGIDPAGSVAVRLMFTASTRFDAASRAPLIEELLRRIRGLPNIRAAGMGGGLPPSYSIMMVGLSSDRGGPMFMMNLMPTTPGYLEAIGARLQRGRMLTAADLGSDRHAVVLSTSTARRFFADRDPIGEPMPFAIPGSQLKPIVVGIVEDVKFGGLDRAKSALMFVPWTDFPSGTMYVAAKGRGDPTALAASVGRVIRDLDPGLPVPDVKPLTSTIADTLVERRLRALVAIGFAVVAVAVALLGLAGALTRAVVERRRELGIRIALGSTPRRTTWLVLREAALLIAAGLAAGLPIAALAARALSHMLYGIKPTDAVTLVLTPTSLALAALMASYVPAHRASEIDPMALLRE